MTTTKTTIHAQALQAAQATPLEQARVYLYQNLRTLERNAKPKGVAVQVRIAIDDFVRHSEQRRRDLVDELEASRHHAKGLSSHNSELLKNIEVYGDAYENQKTLTRNALIESRNMADARYELEGQVRELKQQAGDAPAAQDVIDRLRKQIDRLNEEIYIKSQTIIRMSERDETIRKLREAARIAGDHTRSHNDAVGVILETLESAQETMRKWLTGEIGERQAMTWITGTLDNGIIHDAQKFFSDQSDVVDAEIDFLCSFRTEMYKKSHLM